MSGKIFFISFTIFITCCTGIFARFVEDINTFQPCSGCAEATDILIAAPLDGDITSALNSAINNNPTLPSLRIILPAGSFTISGRIDIQRSCVSIIGAGTNENSTSTNTTITANANMAEDLQMFRIGDSANQMNITCNVSMSNLILDANSDERISDIADPSCNFRNTIRVMSLYYGTFENLVVRNNMLDGIYITRVSYGGDVPNTRSTYILVKNCIVKNSFRNNIALIFSNNVTIEGCEIKGLHEFGRTPGSGVHIEPNFECSAYPNTPGYFDWARNENINISGNTISESSGAGIHISEVLFNSNIEISDNDIINSGLRHNEMDPCDNDQNLFIGDAIFCTSNETNIVGNRIQNFKYRGIVAARSYIKNAIMKCPNLQYTTNDGWNNYNISDNIISNPNNVNGENIYGIWLQDFYANIVGNTIEHCRISIRLQGIPSNFLNCQEDINDIISSNIVSAYIYENDIVFYTAEECENDVHRPDEYSALIVDPVTNEFRIALPTTTTFFYCPCNSDLSVCNPFGDCYIDCDFPVSNPGGGIDVDIDMKLSFTTNYALDLWMQQNNCFRYLDLNADCCPVD